MAALLIWAGGVAEGGIWGVAVSKGRSTQACDEPDTLDRAGAHWADSARDGAERHSTEHSDGWLSASYISTRFISRLWVHFRRNMLKRANLSIIFFIWVLVTEYRSFYFVNSLLLFLQYILFLFYVVMTEHSGRKAEGTDRTAYSAFEWKEEKRRRIEGQIGDFYVLFTFCCFCFLRFQFSV